MYCPKCGKELREGAAFCNGCGCSLTEPQIGNESQAKIKRWPMFLILSGIGIMGMLIIRFFLTVSSKNLFGEISSRTIGATCDVFVFWSLILLVVEAILMFSRKPIKKTLTSVLPIILEAVFVILLLVLAPNIATLFFAPYGMETLSMMIPLLRRAALLTIIPLIVSGTLAFFIGKHSSVWSIVISCLAVVLAFGTALLILHDIYIGKRMVAELIFAVGLLQPFATLIPLTVKNRSSEHKKQIKTTQTNQINTVPKSKIMFCPNCGMRFPNGKKFCDQCGSELKEKTATENTSFSQANPQDAKSTGFGVLGFFFPAIGLILYLVWKDSMPLRAKSTGKGALAGAITWVALTILIYVVYFIIIASLF